MTDADKARDAPRVDASQSSPDDAPDGPPDGPWQVDGVSDTARQAAEAAARRDGLDIGPWMERAVREAARAPKGSVTVTTQDIVAALDALSERIAAAEASTQQLVAPLRDRLDALSRQLAEIEQAAAGPQDDPEPAAHAAHRRTPPTAEE